MKKLIILYRHENSKIKELYYLSNEKKLRRKF